MAINPVNSNPVAPLRSQPITPRQQVTEGEKVGFGQVLGSAIDKVNSDQQSAQIAIEDLLTGNSQDVVPAVAAMAEADMSFKLLMGVRNKVIEAYKQTMNMQI